MKPIQFRNLFPAGPRFLIWCTAFGLGLLIGIPAAAQLPFPQIPSAGNGKYSQHGSDGSTPFGDETTPTAKRVLMLNAARQKSLVSDTEKLLRLAKELNDEMAGADSANMTDAQLRKVAEIGKLAKSVKEKMSFSTGAYPTFANPVNSGP